MLSFNNSFSQKCRVSDKPGQTQSIDFYSIGTGNYAKDVGPAAGEDRADQSSHSTVKSLLITDLPGYGFSFMKPELHEHNMGLMSRSHTLFFGPTAHSDYAPHTTRYYSA